jgi:ATP-dependent Clp protease ATP-binding subunit ClpA
VIQEHIKKPLAEEVLFGKLKRGGTVKVTVVVDEAGKPGLKLEAIGDEVPVSPKKEDPRKAPASKKAAKKPSSAKAQAKPRPAGKKPAGRQPDAPQQTSRSAAKRSIVPQLPRKS